MVNYAKNTADPYTEIAEILPIDAVLGGVNSTCRVTPDKLNALSEDAKKMLISLGMIPEDKNAQITEIKITNKYLRKYYGE